MRTSIVVLVAGGVVAAVALTGCGGSSSASMSSSASAAAPSSSVAPPSAPASESAASGGGNVDGTCTELVKLVNDEQVQALIAGQTDGSLSSILTIGEELAPMLGDFLSDLPKDAPAPVTKDLLNVAGLLATGVTAGSLTDDEFEQLESSTNSVLNWASQNCGVNIGGGAE